MTTVRGGIATARRPLTVEQRIAKAAREAKAAAVSAMAAGEDAGQALLDAAEAQSTVDGALDGTEAFTGLNVGGTQVKPFLDRTDGDKLTEAAGLDAAIVTTAKVEPNGITNEIVAETSASLTLGGTAFTTIQTVSYTSTGGRLKVRGNFFMTVHHPTVGGISARVRIVQSLPFGGNLIDLTYDAIGGDYIQGWQTPEATVTLAAGTYTFDLIVSLSNNDAAVQAVQGRTLSVTELKR